METSFKRAIMIIVPLITLIFLVGAIFGFGYGASLLLLTIIGIFGTIGLHQYFKEETDMDD